jgi:hypothetical protein
MQKMNVEVVVNIITTVLKSSNAAQLGLNMGTFNFSSLLQENYSCILIIIPVIDCGSLTCFRTLK